MTLHTGKTVKCPDCDKKFSRASYLILHRREHVKYVKFIYLPEIDLFTRRLFIERTNIYHTRADNDIFFYFSRLEKDRTPATFVRIGTNRKVI